MKVLENGVMRTMTDEEVQEFERQNQLFMGLNSKNPLSEQEVTRLIIENQINNLTVDNNTALRMKAYYPEWKEGVYYSTGYKVRYKETLWEVVQEHTSQVTWEPANAVSLWKQINESSTGELTDPISYNGNMVLENGKYYIQNDAIYMCNRNTEIPVYNALSELEGLYVTRV